MADAVVYEGAVHPCAHCAGMRKIEERSWRTPSFLVQCQSCGNLADGESLDEAILAWNDVNPDREVSPDDQHAAALLGLSPLLTLSFLDTLVAAAAVFPQSGQPQTVEAFVEWCLGASQ